MATKLIHVEKISVIAAAGVFSALAVVFVLGLNLTQAYPDFITGALAFGGGYKLQDIIVGPVFVVVMALCVLTFTKMIRNLRENAGCIYSESIARQLILWSIPAFISVLGFVFNKKITAGGLVISSGAILITSVLCFFYRKKNEMRGNLIGFCIISAIFISFIPAEIYLVTSRLSSEFLGYNNTLLYVKIVTSVFFASGIIFYFHCWVTRKEVEAILPRVIFFGQVGLSLLFLMIYPAKILSAGEVVVYDTDVSLKFVVAFFVLSAIYDAVRRYLKYKSAGEMSLLFSPVAVFALFVGLKYGYTNIPRINADDYHFGENLIGWWSYSKDFLPYVDYIPSHGMIQNDFVMFLSSFFYDGTAASYSEASRLGFVVLSFFAFISVFFFSRNVIFSFFVVLSLGRYGWLFLVPFICLLFSPSLRRDGAKWLVAWLVSTPIIILGLPPQGLLLVISFGFMVLSFAWFQFRDGNIRSWMAIFSVMVVLIFLALVTPAGAMLYSAVRYVIENGFINQVAYGVPWYGSKIARSDFVLLFLQSAWMLVAFLCLMVVYSRRKDINKTTSVVYPAMTIFLFIISLVPYAMGRIDGGGVSRPGQVSLLSLGVLFPIVALSFIKSNFFVDQKRKEAAFCFLLLFMCVPIGFSNGSIFSFQAFVRAILPVVHAPLLIDGKVEGLGNIGKGIIQDEQWGRLTRINAFLSDKLLPGEPYLDLTSRNAHYFYFNRKPIVEVTAPYNMVSLAQQKRVIEKLEMRIPDVALLGANNINHDGGGVALRNPLLYRFVIDNYVPSMEDGFIVGYRRETDAQMELGGLPREILGVVDPITDNNWDRGYYRRGAAIVLKEPALVAVVNVGDTVRIGDEVRNVTKVIPQGRSIWLDGDLILPEILPEKELVYIRVKPGYRNEYRALLFQNAFSPRDLNIGKVPVSWGRSERSLREKMIPVESLDDLQYKYKDVVAENGVYRVTGRDPQIIIDMLDEPISGRDAGLLKFDFFCHGQRKDPKIQIFWWGDHRSHPLERYSLKFAAESGTLIVPLDASPLWLTLEEIKGVRIDLDDADACRSFNVDNVGLFQRRF